MKARIARRAARVRDRQRMAFLDPQSVIPRTQIKVQNARGASSSAARSPAIFADSGFKAPPGSPARRDGRNGSAQYRLRVALGRRRLDVRRRGCARPGLLDVARHQRNLKQAIHRDPVFLKVAEQVAGEMNAWAKGFTIVAGLTVAIAIGANTAMFPSCARRCWLRCHSPMPTVSSPYGKAIRRASRARRSPCRVTWTFGRRRRSSPTRRRAFVISGNLGQRDARARYDLPPAQIERYVAGFLAEVSSG